MSLRWWPGAAALLFSCGLSAQVIQFESGGLRYQTLSKSGVTVMFAHLPATLREYAILQVGISNGSAIPYVVRPEDFAYERQDGNLVRAAAAKTVVDSLLEHASRHDVIKLISTYEATLYGVSQLRSTNGYEQRRQSYLAEMGNNKLKAAAAASAIAFVLTKLKPGESTDGAVFFITSGKALGPGRLTARISGISFDFEAEPPAGGKTLQPRGSGSN